MTGLRRVATAILHDDECDRADVQAAFRARQVFFRVRYRPWFWRGDFTWIWKNYSIWRRVLAPLRSRDTRVLEIRSFEGRSALFFLKYLPRSTIVCIDTFASTLEESRQELFVIGCPWSRNRTSPCELNVMLPGHRNPGGLHEMEQLLRIRLSLLTKIHGIQFHSSFVACASPGEAQ
jgi:hypothetical protein